MIRLNKKQIITISIVIAVIFASALAITIAAQYNKLEMSSDLTVSQVSDVTAGQNGVVANGYTTTYTSGTAISNAQDLADFLADVDGDNVTAANEKYGYLTADITYSGGVTDKAFKYAHLDGCGHTITLTSATSGSISYMGKDRVETYITHMSSYYTPFGYYKNSSGIYATGFIGAVAYKSTLKNINFVFSGHFEYDSGQQGELSRPLSAGVIFGYMYGTSIDNCSLTLNNGSYFYYYQSTSGIDNDRDAQGTACVGGFTGVLDNYNLTGTSSINSVISNSSINLLGNSYIRGGSHGRKSTFNQRVGSPRVFVGGMAGVLCNSAKIYNAYASGSGTIIAKCDGPTYQNDRDRAGLGGIIVGSNATNFYYLYSVGEQKDVVTNGTIDGVICAWTGTVQFHIGERFVKTSNSGYGRLFSNIGSEGEYEYAGAINGYGVQSALKNIYYSYSRAELATLSGVNDTSLVYAMPTEGYNANASYMSRYIYDQSVQGDDKYVAQNSARTAIDDDSFNFVWADNTEQADVKVYADSKKLDSYSSDTGLFVWNFDLTASSSDVKNLCSTATSAQQAVDSYSQYVSTVVIPRTTLSLSATLKVRFGYAAYYQLDSNDSYDKLLSSRIYDGTTGVSVTPTINLYSYNPNVAGNKSVLKYLDSSSYVAAVSGQTVLTRSDIWTVNEGNGTAITSLIPKALSDVKNYGYYYIFVAKQSLNENYAFLDDDSSIVSYASDVTTNLNKIRTASPYYYYRIDKRVIEGEWSTIHNNMDNVDYTAPQNFVYCGQNIAFSYVYKSGIQTGDSAINIGMTYYNATYTPVPANSIVDGVDYYAMRTSQNGNYYEKIGQRGDFTVDSEATYYTLNIGSATQSIQNAGNYIVEIADSVNQNYTLLSSSFTTLQFPVSVYKREIEVEYNINLTNTGEEQQVSYIVVNKVSDVADYTTDITKPLNNYIRFDSLNNETTVNNANIIIYNMCDASSLTITYTPGTLSNEVDYINGPYNVEVRLRGYGAANYIIPTTGTGAEDFHKLITENGKTVGFYRTVIIGSPVVKLVRVTTSNVTGASRNTDDDNYYTEYDNIVDKTPAVIYGADIESAENVSTYLETSSYKGYNSLIGICALQGIVSYDSQFSENVFSQIESTQYFYKAKLEDGVYKKVDASAEPTVNMVGSTGLYIVKITFDSLYYPSYNQATFYVVFEVTKVALQIKVDTDVDGAEYTYSSNDYVNTINDMKLAEIDGVNPGEFSKSERRKVVITYKYLLNGVEVDNMINAGNYTVVITSNINKDNYSFSGNYVDIGTGSNGIKTMEYEGEQVPYVNVVVKPLEITVTTVNDTENNKINTKVYSTEFTSDDVNYTTEGTFVEGEENDVAFTCDGFAANANVGEYSIVAVSTSGNYVYTMAQESVKLTVTPLDIVFEISDSEGNELSKPYGDSYVIDTANVKVKEGYARFVDELVEDDVYIEVDSLGFADDADVSAEGYAYTFTIMGADKDNYNVSLSEECVFTVNPRVLTLDSVSAAVDCVYDNTNKAPQVTFANIALAQELTANIKYFVKNSNNAYVETEEAVNAGDYAILVLGVDDGNYSYEPTQNAYDLEFTVTKRAVSVVVSNFTMGYGDTKLLVENADTTNGFVYSVGSAEFVEDDLITLDFVASQTIMESPISSDPYEKVVGMVILGEHAANYELTVAAEDFGNLTIVGKDLAEIALKNATLVFTGEELEVELDTTASSDEWTMEIFSDEERTIAVDSVKNVGTYYITVTAAENSEVFTGSNNTLVLTVVKGDFDTSKLTKQALTVHYNKVVIGGIFEGVSIMAGKSRDNLKEGNVVDGLTGSSKHTIYVQIVDDDNYNDSEIMSISITTTYDPSKINQALSTLGNKFGFSGIATYRSILSDCEKVMEEDKELINTSALNAATARYNTLVNSSKSVVSSAQSVAAKTAKVGYEVAAAAVPSVGILVAGAMMCLKKRNKKEDQ